MKNAVILFLVISLGACTAKLVTDDQTSTTADADLTSYIAALKAAGVTDEEAAAISTSIASDLGAASVTAVSDESVAAKADVFASASVKALSASVFATEARREDVAEIASGETVKQFGNQLKDSTAEILAGTLASVFSSNFDLCSYVGTSASEKVSHIKKVLRKVISEAAGIKDDAEFRKAFADHLGQKISASFKAKSCISDLSEIEAAVPEILQSSLLGLGNISAASSPEKINLSTLVLDEALAALPDVGLSASQITAVSDSLDTSVDANSSQLSSLSSSEISLIKESARLGVACNESTRFAYMYEYSDSRCQTLVRKYIDGPIVSSPMNKGFPNFRFCFLNDTNGLYYNWVAADSGCHAKPDVATIPAAGPSPRTDAITVSTAAGCAWGLLGGGGMTSSIKRLGCESNGMLNFINNQITIEVRFANITTMVFDTAAGYTFPLVGKRCDIRTTGGMAYHSYFVRNRSECTDFCENVMKDYPSSDFQCAFDSNLMKTYAVNELLARSTEGKKAVHVVPGSGADTLEIGSCRPIQIKHVLASDGSLVADIARVNLQASNQKVGSDYSQLPIYSDSACKVPITQAMLAASQAQTIYVKPDAAASEINVHANTTSGYVRGFSAQYLFSGSSTPSTSSVYCPAGEGTLSGDRCIWN